MMIMFCHVFLGYGCYKTMCGQSVQGITHLLRSLFSWRLPPGTGHPPAQRAHTTGSSEKLSKRAQAFFWRESSTNAITIPSKALNS
jgi:hypothetical protein